MIQNEETIDDETNTNKEYMHDNYCRTFYFHAYIEKILFMI